MARQLAAAAGSSATFVVGTISPDEPDGDFDRICGRFALHHTDLAVTGPVLAGKLRASGIAAFLETMATNPLLRAARLASGHFRIPRYGTPDEHPLTSSDVRFLRATFGEARCSAPVLVFFRMLDRQLLGFRHRRISGVLGAIDDGLGRIGLTTLSYQQVIVLRRAANAAGS